MYLTFLKIKMNEAPSLFNRPMTNFIVSGYMYIKNQTTKYLKLFEMRQKNIHHIFEYDYTSKVLLDFLVLEKNYTFFL